MKICALVFIFVSFLASISATKPPSCFKPCLHNIAQWGEGGLSNLTNICSNHLSLVGCLIDICEGASLLQAKNHFFDTCKANNIDYELITNSTTLRIIEENNKHIKDTRNLTATEKSNDDTSANNQTKETTDLIKKLKETNVNAEPITENSQEEQETANNQDENKSESETSNSDELNPEISSTLKSIVYQQNNNRQYQVLQKKKSNIFYQNEGAHPADFKDVEGLEDESIQIENDFEDPLELIGQKVDAKLVSNKVKDHDVTNKISDAVSHRLPEPVVKFYKTHKPIYDSDGIEVDQFNGFTNGHLDQGMKSKNYRFLKHQNQPAIGNSKVENSKAANHMPMLNDD